MAKIKRRTTGDFFTDIIFIVILLIIGLVCIYPIWFVLIASISDPSHIANGQVIIIPSGINFDAYTEVFRNKDIWMGYRNSLIYLFSGTFIMFAITLPAAYSLSRRRLHGRRWLNFAFVISMYVSGGLIPTYLLHKSLGWIGTPWVLLIPAGLSVYNMILARSSFDSLPYALYESAQLDGASDFRFFFGFAIPLTKATLAVLFLYTGLTWWNMYMPFVIYISKPELQSLQVVIRSITHKLTSTVSQDTATTAELMEAERQKELLKYSTVVIAAIPFCMLYPFVQKYFNKGVMVGAVKG